MANEHPTWRNVGLGDTSNVAAHTTRSFSRFSIDAFDCLSERGVAVTAWLHLMLSVFSIDPVRGIE